MRNHKVLVLLFGGLIAITPQWAFGTTGSVIIDFGGLCSQITIAQPPPFYLFAAGGSYTCSSGGTDYFKIEDNGSNRAQVLPASSGNDSDTGTNGDDTLRIKDWKITALTPTPSDRPQGYEISVWLQYDNPPSTDGPGGNPDVYYKSTLNGTITKRTGNWVKMDPGYVTNPLGAAETTLGTAKTYTPTCPVSPCTLSGLSTSGKWPDSPNYLNGSRILRAKYAFSLKAANDVLLINSTGGKLNSQGSADIDPDECSEQYCQCPSTIKFITVSSSKFSYSVWGTTSGKSEDMQVSSVERFTRVNWASLQQDMAQGGGEYLASLAALWKIPADQQEEFYTLAQRVYRSESEQGTVRRDQILSRLEEERTSQGMVVAGLESSKQ